jgi:hypothetical protein
MEDDLKKKKMEDDLKKKNEKQPKFFFQELEWRPQKNGRWPQIIFFKWKTTKKNKNERRQKKIKK